MRCYECFHYNACGNASMYVDTEMCKQALPTKEITELKTALKTARRQITRLQFELDYATDCINEVEDALYQENKNDEAKEAIDRYRKRWDDSL